MTWIYWTL